MDTIVSLYPPRNNQGPKNRRNPPSYKEFQGQSTRGQGRRQAPWRCQAQTGNQRGTPVERKGAPQNGSQNIQYMICLPTFLLISMIHVGNY